jgi:F-type H+-transporting ATPase subunit b
VINLDQTLIIQMINFLILLWILNRFLYKPILKILDERRGKIHASETEVEELKARAAGQWESYQRQLQEARIEANAEKERIKAEGAEAERRLLEEARAEAARLLEDSRRMIQEEVLKARDLLRAQAGAVASEMASKILGRSLQ